MFGNWTLNPTELSICSAINLLTFSSSVHLLIQPFIHPCTVAKGPCLFVALIIWTNFLCNLFPSQPPTWSSSVRLLKVEPLIPASPFPPITSCFSPSASLRCFVFTVLKVQLEKAKHSFFLNCNTSQTPLMPFTHSLFLLSSIFLHFRPHLSVLPLFFLFLSPSLHSVMAPQYSAAVLCGVILPRHVWLWVKCGPQRARSAAPRSPAP